jgi:hypothetical protein
MLSYAHCIREDPVRRGLLYLGTENAIYVSFNDGEQWQPLQNNLPAAPVYWITVQEHFNDLVIATYGRGFWILDDLSPLQQFGAPVLSSEVHLFQPRAAYRYRDITPEASATNDATVGENPPYGAAINYHLKSAATGPVVIGIEDAQEQTIRTLQAPRTVGLNRIYWDLRHAPSKEVRLRTSPLYAPEIEVGPDGFRPGGGARLSLLALPGTYTVRLTVGGKNVTQKLAVRKDPNSGGSDAELTEQMKMLVDLRRDLDQATDMINQLELVRSQIYGLARLTNDAAVRKAGEDLDAKLIGLEMNLIELRVTGRGQDGVRWGAKLHGKIGYLANGLMGGDFKPTAQQAEVKKEVEDRLRGHASDLDGLLSQQVGAFNDMLRQRNLPTIVTRLPD